MCNYCWAALAYIKITNRPFAQEDGPRTGWDPACVTQARSAQVGFVATLNFRHLISPLGLQFPIWGTGTTALPYCRCRHTALGEALLLQPRPCFTPSNRAPKLSISHNIYPKHPPPAPSFQPQQQEFSDHVAYLKKSSLTPKEGEKRSASPNPEAFRAF